MDLAAQLGLTDKRDTVNIILILGSERIYSDIIRKYPTTPNNPGESAPSNDGPTVLKLPKSGGVVDRAPAYIAQIQSQQLKAYFFGTANLPLSPYTQSIPTTSADCPLTMYRLPPSSGAADEAGASFLPGDHEDVQASGRGGSGLQRLEKVELGPDAERAVLVVKHAAADARVDEIRDASVMGWLYVVDVEVDKKRARVLSPVGGRLPSANACVWGRWPEALGGVVG